MLGARREARAEHACRTAVSCIPVWLLYEQRSELQLLTLVRASISSGASLAAVSLAAGF